MDILAQYGRSGDMGKMGRQQKQWLREREKRLLPLCNMRFRRARIFPRSTLTCVTYVDLAQLNIRTA